MLGVGDVSGVVDAKTTQRASMNTALQSPVNKYSFSNGLTGLLQRNQVWTNALPDDYFSDVQNGQAPSVTTVCCSDSRVSQEGMFLGALEAGFLFKPSNIGNKAISIVEGERVVDGDFLYGLEKADSENGVVVGHTDCGAITAAYEIATGNQLNESAGIRQELEVLVDIVDDGLKSDLVDTETKDLEVINQLAEYNVHRQVQFLLDSDAVSEERNLYGFVYDFQGAYGGMRGRTYLVNIDGETDPCQLKQQVPNRYEEFVQSILH
ncbi:carbonic anhydrase [Haloterrigena sp. SYSU A121-1]|uniref:carbonic anhydrase n=2 Tax=Haloterrigena gelatinilytica TaxID=2741724 RepID=A0A8J8GRC2_9EURY|nr:carbonic anhydrase [Haloterrigena gelatinilytica]